METEKHLLEIMKDDYLAQIKEILIKKNIFDDIDDVLTAIENGTDTAYFAKNQSSDQVTKERQLSAIACLENIFIDLRGLNINHEIIKEEIEK